MTDFLNGFKTNINSKYLKYWHGKYNLGDVFSDFLLDSIYDKNLLDQVQDRKTLMFIGSEIPYWADNSNLVCGLGWQYKNKKTLQQKNVNSSSFCYVRGRISRQNVIDAGVNIPHDLPIGDTGLLASLLYRPSSEKIHDIGIITHWSAKERLGKYLETAQKIFPEKDIAVMQMGAQSKSPLDLFEFISSCRTIVASSLHAIIFSHSFGVPALFFSDVGEYKFQDYYSVYDRIDYEHLIKWTSLETALENAYDNQFVHSINPSLEEVRQKQRDILHAMPYRWCFTDKGKNLLEQFGISPDENDERAYYHVQNCFFMQNKDQDVLKKSSSGGVVPEIVDLVRSQGGSCFGVVFADDFLSLKYVEIDDSNKNLAMGSKYINSMLDEVNKKRIAELLESGKQVVFIGRPCQCHWMRNNFRKYKNLVLVELFCFGVPDDNLWKNYIGELISEHGKIKSVNFRDKLTGWKNYSLTIEFENGYVLSEPNGKNRYMCDYLSRKNLMQKCHVCKFKSEVKSQSDILCGDAWGVNAENDNGTSIVLANTLTGENILRKLKNKFILSCPDDGLMAQAKKSNSGFPSATMELNASCGKKTANPPKLEFLNEPQSKQFDVVVSFATYRLRIEKEELYQSMDSIVNQKFNGKFHVVVNLWKPDYDSAPQKLKDYFNEHNIEVILTDRDYRTHNKYCFAFEKYAGIPIATFDDDQIYREDALQLLFDTYKRHPRTLIGGFCVIPGGIVDKKTGRRGKPRPPTGTPPQRGIQIWGSGGNFYPPEFTYCIRMDLIERWIKTMNGGARYDNDMFLFRMAKVFEFNGMVVECNHKRPTWRGYLVEKFLPTADDETAKTWTKG